jgi:hypothetical protein
LTLDQRIGLKGEFETNKECAPYKVIMKLWNFIIAVEYFLNDDLSILTPVWRPYDGHNPQSNQCLNS